MTVASKVRDHAAALRFIAERARTPFAWKANDCVSFAAGAVHAQTGRDVLKDMGLRYRTEVGAAKALARRGGLEAAVGEVLTPIAPAMAKRGDVAGVQGPSGLMLTVIEGETLAGPGDHGVERWPRAAMLKAWSAD